VKRQLQDKDPPQQREVFPDRGANATRSMPEREKPQQRALATHREPHGIAVNHRPALRSAHRPELLDCLAIAATVVGMREELRRVLEELPLPTVGLIRMNPATGRQLRDHRLFPHRLNGDLRLEGRIEALPLYLPPGQVDFGSREAHGLTYTSCQESHDPLFRRIAAELRTSGATVRWALKRPGGLLS
jgi:hypothetical protein